MRHRLTQLAGACIMLRSPREKLPDPALAVRKQHCKRKALADNSLIYKLEFPKTSSVGFRKMTMSVANQQLGFGVRMSLLLSLLTLGRFT